MCHQSEERPTTDAEVTEDNRIKENSGPAQYGTVAVFPKKINMAVAKPTIIMLRQILHEAT